MKRTTIVLPDELAALVEYERKRRDVSAADVIRAALEHYFAQDLARPELLGFVGLGRSGRKDTARKSEEILARDMTADAIRR